MKALGLVVFGVLVFAVGRYVADTLIRAIPAYAYAIEKVVLLICLLVVVFFVMRPFFEGYGLYRKRQKQTVEDQEV